MNINKLTIGEAKKIIELLGSGNNAESNSTINDCIGKVCVIRTYSAGVHYGTVEKKSGTNVLLSQARRIYSWSDAFTLSELSQNGCSGRVAKEVPMIELTQAIEIIPMSEKAISIIGAIHE